MLMSVQLHDCPSWPSVALPTIDQGRVSGALALGRRRDEFIISPYGHVQCFLTRAATARCLCASVMWNRSYRLISGDKVGSVSQHSDTPLSPGSYQTPSRCTALEKMVSLKKTALWSTTWNVYCCKKIYQSFHLHDKWWNNSHVYMVMNYQWQLASGL